MFSQNRLTALKKELKRYRDIADKCKSETKVAKEKISSLSSQVRDSGDKLSDATNTSNRLSSQNHSLKQDQMLLTIYVIFQEQIGPFKTI